MDVTFGPVVPMGGMFHPRRLQSDPLLPPLAPPKPPSLAGLKGDRTSVGPIRRWERGYILATGQSGTRSAGMFESGRA
eukprot:8464725-Pyramimonas_sp.AAC.1